MKKKRSKKTHQWLSKTRYQAKKRKEKLLSSEKAVRKLKCPPNQKCFVYHVESVNKRSTYIGYTTTPTKRLRQHNGELAGGARCTHKARPWSFGLILHCPSSWFNKIHAQQLEYACKHFSKQRKNRGKLEYVSQNRAHPSLIRKIDNLLWACHNRAQFTGNFPLYDGKNPDHCLSIYLVDELVPIVKPLFANAPYWKPEVLPLSEFNINEQKTETEGGKEEKEKAKDLH